MTPRRNPDIIPIMVYVLLILTLLLMVRAVH